MPQIKGYDDVKKTISKIESELKEVSDINDYFMGISTNKKNLELSLSIKSADKHTNKQFRFSESSVSDAVVLELLKCLRSSLTKDIQQNVRKYGLELTEEEEKILNPKQ